jgi:nucleotide-binding universal stress UspA family protein
VTRPIGKFFHGEQHLTPLDWEERLPPDIARFVDHLDGYGIAHEKHLAPGRAGRSITIEAASRRRDLIVMGASERGLFENLLRGAPVEEVLRETPCNLIIFKPGK